MFVADIPYQPIRSQNAGGESNDVRQNRNCGGCAGSGMWWRNNGTNNR